MTRSFLNNEFAPIPTNTSKERATIAGYLVEPVVAGWGVRNLDFEIYPRRVYITEGLAWKAAYRHWMLSY